MLIYKMVLKLKKLPNNQITEYFLYNNSPLLLPVTSLCI